MPSRQVRRLAGFGISLGVVVATFVFVLPEVANYSAVWGAVRRLEWWEVLALLGAVVFNLVTFAPPWMAALPRLGFRQAFVVTQASTASTYIAPGGAAPGIAVSFAMLKAWGFGVRQVTLAVTLTSVWNQLVILGVPIVALGLLGLSHEQSPALETAALLGLIAFGAIAAALGLAFSSARLARTLGDLAARFVSSLLRLVRRPPVKWGGENVARFRRDTIGLLGRRWHVLTLATLLGHGSVFVVFLATLRVLGVSSGDVSLVEAFAAWALARVLGSLPVTPGGIGVVELGLTGVLVGFGADNAEAVAAVLVYRFLTMVPTILLGLLAGATWRRHHPGAIEAETTPSGPREVHPAP